MASNGKFPRFPQPFAIPAGPFVGINDTPALSAQDASRAASMQNCYVPVPGGDVYMRPGTTRTGIGTATAITGTATSIAMAAGTTGYTITGTSTLFTTELAVGDVLVSASGAEVIITAIGSATSLTGTCEVAGTFAGALTYYPAGVVTGPLNVIWQSIYSDGTTQRFFLAKTAVKFMLGSAAGLYHFGASTNATLTGTLGTFPNGSAAVTGAGTLFTTELAVGDIIIFQNLGGGTIAGGPFYSGFGFIVLSIADNTHLTVTSVNSGTGGGGETLTANREKYVLVQYDPSNATHSFTNRTSASMNLTPFATSSRAYVASFADYWILSDSVNQPWKVTEAEVLSALTGYTAAVQGRPTVYYGKLFFIKGAEKSTIVWSEENDPDTGYEAGGFNNSWTLRQTSPDGLEAIEGTNTALYVFRQNSITAITGAVNTDFATAGTQDAISTTTGTRSPDAVVTVGDSVFFLDSQCRPQVIDPGRGVIPLYSRITQTLGTSLPSSGAQLQKAWGRCVTGVTGNPLIVWCFPATESASTQVAYLIFDAYTRECLGQWTLPSAPDTLYGTIWRDANGLPRFTVSSHALADVAIYQQRAESDATVYYDQTSAGTNAAVDSYVVTPKMAGDTQIEKLFTRIDMTSGDISGNEATLTVAYQGAASAGFSAEKAMDHVNVTTGFPNKFARMTDIRGRWAQYRFRNDTSVAARAAFGELQIEGVAFEDTPKMA